MVEAEGEEEGEEAVGVGGGRKIEKARASERGGGGASKAERGGEVGGTRSTQLAFECAWAFVRDSDSPCFRGR